MAGEFTLRKGDYIAVVKANEGRYEFFVRDLRREDPTVQGMGVDYFHALAAATQLLDALAGGR